MPKKTRIAVKKRARPTPPAATAETGPGKRRRPPAGAVVELVSPDGPGVPEPIVDELIRTRVWVIIASVLFFLGSLGSLVSMGFAIAELVKSGSAEAGPGAVTGSGMMAVVVAIIYLMAATILATIAARMCFFAGRIGRLEKSGVETDLEFVLTYLKGFWTMLGGGTLTMIAIAILLVFLQFRG